VKTAQKNLYVAWTQRWLILTAVLVTVGVFGLRTVLVSLGGAAPFWDALTTILSAIAQLYLMERYLESWYLWIVADTIYVPLYASRGLYLTSILYAIFWLMAIYGLQNFQRIYSEQKLKQQQSL
jgi:nicotinamide mononucleotide transporter